MTVLKTSLNKILKSTAFIVIASALMACQGETSANADSVTTQAAVIENTASQQVVSETQNVVTEQVAQATTQVVEAAPIEYTPRPPADFSDLDDSKYKPVSQPFTVTGGDKVEVTELFWFGCSHCFALEPQLKSWIKTKPANARFRKVPAVFSQRWEFHARAFYTMEALGVPDEAYDEFFNQLHIKRKNINNIKALSTFLFRYGKSKAEVEAAFNSFAVDSKFRNAVKITKASGARGVPALIVDGKYLTSQTDAGGTAQMFDVIDKLVAKVASER